MYLIGETEMSVETIIKTFKVAEGFVKSLDQALERIVSYFLETISDDKRGHRFFGNWGSKFGPIWLPQIFYGMSEPTDRLII